ncbi:MAG: DUF3037 domain-containing protein [Acidimicrobiia bacterium]|nr:DUF3037 domain-containing protein [Acidimicrobiia bacterium]
MPDPARGEFVNVGAIVGSEESSEWQVRQIENPKRARAIDENASLDAVWSFIDRVGIEIDNFEAATQSLLGPDVELTEDWLWRLHADHQNIVQLSAPVPMVAESADEALESVFDLMVLDPAVRKYSFTKKHTALAALRRAYDKFEIAKGRERRERVTLRTPHHAALFDFAVTNGQVVQLTQAWSFQVPDQATLAEQVKAWGWTVQEALHTGGRVCTPVGEFDAGTDVAVEVVYVPALPTRPAPAFVDAEHVFDELGVRAVSHDQAGDVARRARELLGPLPK